MTTQQELRRRTIYNNRQSAIRQRTQEQSYRASEQNRLKLELQAKVNNYVEMINKGEILDLNQIPPNIRKYVNVSQEQLNQIKKNKEIKSWKKELAEYNHRHKAFFLGLNPSREEVKRYNEFRKAIEGKESSVPDYVVKALKKEVVHDFEYTPKVVGLNRGQKASIITKNKQGDIIRKEVYSNSKEGVLSRNIYIKPKETSKVSYVGAESLEGVKQNQLISKPKSLNNRFSLNNNEHNTILDSSNSRSSMGIQRRNSNNSWINIFNKSNKKAKEAKENTKFYGQAVVSKANRWQEEVKSGYISGSLNYIADKVSGYVKSKEVKMNMKSNRINANPYGASKVTRIVARNAPYFIPGLGTALLVGEGAEKYITPKGKSALNAKKYKLKAEGRKTWSANIQPVSEIVLGGVSSILKLRGTTVERATKAPKKIEAQSEVRYTNKMSVETKSKPKIIKDSEGNIIPARSSSQTVTRREIGNPITKTVTKGKGYKDIQYSDKFGNAQGTITKEKWGLFGKKTYRTEYNVNAERGTGQYRIFKGKKLIKEFEAKPTNDYGFGEPILKTKVKRVSEKTLPDKTKVKNINEQRVYSQKLIKVNKKGKYDILSGEQKTFINTNRELKASPLKTKLISRAEQLNPKSSAKFEIELGRKTAKFTKGGGARDIESIKNIEASNKGLVVGSKLYKTPRVAEKTIQTGIGKGKFILERKNAFDKFIESQRAMGKRGQISLGTPELRLNKLRQVSEPTMKVKTPNIASKYYLAPEVKTGSGAISKVGVIATMGIGNKSKSIYTNKPKIKNKTLVVQKGNELQLVNSAILNKVKHSHRHGQGLLNVQLPAQASVQAQTQISVLQNAQAQTSASTDVTSTRERYSKSLNPEIKKIKPIMPITLPSTKGEVYKSIRKPKLNVLDVFVRRRGKDIKVGSSRTEYGAKKLLFQKLKGTLAASGYVSLAGKKKEVHLYSQEFGKSKKDNKRIIQKVGYRLGTKGETTEITMFKKKKGTKRKSKKNKIWGL